MRTQLYLAGVCEQDGFLNDIFELDHRLSVKRFPMFLNSPAFSRHLAGSVSAALQSQRVTASRC